MNNGWNNHERMSDDLQSRQNILANATMLVICQPLVVMHISHSLWLTHLAVIIGESCWMVLLSYWCDYFYKITIYSEIRLWLFHNNNTESVWLIWFLKCCKNCLNYSWNLSLTRFLTTWFHNFGILQYTSFHQSKQ